MIPLSIGQVAEAVAGTLHDVDPATVVRTVITDSRQVCADGLFIAVVGETHDGHEYVGQALSAGCVAALVSRPVQGPHVLVDDTVVAAGRLARAVIEACPDLRVVALTGSSGKTSTKDLLRVVLSSAGSTVAPQGSFNNELGLPRTVFEVTEQTRYLVAEMGARGPGTSSTCAGSPRRMWPCSSMSVRRICRSSAHRRASHWRSPRSSRRSVRRVWAC